MLMAFVINFWSNLWWSQYIAVYLVWDLSFGNLVPSLTNNSLWACNNFKPLKTNILLHCSCLSFENVINYCMDHIQAIPNLEKYWITTLISTWFQVSKRFLLQRRSRQREGKIASSRQEKQMVESNEFWDKRCRLFHHG